MGVENIEKQSVLEQLSDILLVLDTEKKKIQAVKGINEKGELETIDPNKKNQSEFLRVDKHGDIFSNFFSNFYRQLKDATRFTFFKIPVPLAVATAAKLQQQINTPTKEGEKFLSLYEVKPATKQEHTSTQNHQQKNKNNMETTTQTKPQNGEYKYKPEQIDWATMANLGLSKEKLEKLNLLDSLLKGYKTNELVHVSLNLGSVVTRMDARLSLQPGENGQVVMAIHGIRKEQQFDLPFFGHQFSKEDKENLIKTGNMGRVVELVNPKTNEKILSIVSVDRMTNELVALRTDFMKIPDEIKGVKLNDLQKHTLLEGKPIDLKGMTSRKGEPFDATIQYNADKRSIEFIFDRSNTNKLSQSNGQVQEVPRNIRGKELTDEQYQKFKDGQTIYLTDLKDKQGREYKGYLTFNRETGKPEFSFSNPNQLRDKIKPAQEHKTQTEVNNDGKTNEASKKISEPLNSGQKEPDRKKQQDQQKEQGPAKSKGRKI